MHANIFFGQKTSPIVFSELPNGEYEGTWGGYEVTVEIDGATYRFKTEDGIRTFNASVLVTVKDGVVSVETI